MYKEGLQKERVNINGLYCKAKDSILKSGSYSFKGVYEIIKDKGLEENPAIITPILERFYREEGALPGDLGKIYLRALFKKQDLSLNIYDKLSIVKNYLKERKIAIDNNELGEIVAELAKQN